MRSLAVAVGVGGPVAVAGMWALVRLGRASVWPATGIAMAALGAASLLTGEVRDASRFGAGTAVSVGLAFGVALYVATAAFMAVARRWPPVTRHTVALYGEGERVSLRVSLGVSLLLVVPGEELLWRGVVPSVLGGVLQDAAAAAMSWALYVAANAFSGSIAILLGATVGGAAWAALAWWTGGVAASIACHAAWTGLMILVPPPGARR